LPGLFSGINQNEASLYTGLNRLDSLKQFSFISFTGTFNPGKQSTGALARFVRRGNHAFIAARHFGKEFRTHFDISVRTGAYNPGGDSISIHMTSPQSLQQEPFYFFRAFPYNVFTGLDSSSALPLSKTVKDQPVMLRIEVGEGALFLHSAPQCFTNYNLLKRNNYRYAEAALSHLPDEQLIWDAHYKPFNRKPDTPLRFILSRPSLRMAYYVLLVAALLFLFFNARRRQRAIPVWEKPVNTSLNYVRTVGQLYFRQRNDRQLARKKIQHWQEFLRSRFYTETRDYSSAEADRIADKTGVPLDIVQKIFESIQALERETYKEADLRLLNRRIEMFYEKMQAYSDS